MFYDLLITNALCPLQITINFTSVTLRTIGIHGVVSSLFSAVMVKMFKISVLSKITIMAPLLLHPAAFFMSDFSDISCSLYLAGYDCGCAPFPDYRLAQLYVLNSLLYTLP